MIKGLEKLRVGLLGEKLSHSMSPQLHAMLADYNYRIFEVAPEKLDDFIRNGEFDALNVTIPYKKAVIPYMSRLSDEARRTGAVNTIVREDGELVGYNTDVFGFSHMLESSGINVHGAFAIILGSGGASAAVNAALADSGAEKIVTVSRNGEYNYENLNLLYDADILVNATPVGMYPTGGKLPIDLEMFGKLSFFADLIYNPMRTGLILDAKRIGLPCRGGLRMLTAQAIRSCELFTNRFVDITADEAAYKLLSESANVALVGMPGSGKTTVGKRLAEMLGKRFCDTDEAVAKMTGSTPERIINERGEIEFRRLESVAVKEATAKRGCVIACGGGVVTNPDNYLPLTENSVVVLLDRALGELETAGRPLSESRGIETLFSERKELYKKFADITVQVKNAPDETASRIIELLNEKLRDM